MSISSLNRTPGGKTCVAIVFCACAAVGSPTNSSWFTRVWQTDDGLPNNRVNSIVQGRDGYLWIATPEACVKFDGISFEKYFYAGSEGDENRGVQEILPGRAG